MAVKLLLRLVDCGIYQTRHDMRLFLLSGRKHVFIRIYRSHGRVMPKKIARMFWRNIKFVRILVLNIQKPRTIINRM